MRYSRILTIQDISCVGQCSMTVALPILSACGQETCILPSAVLSTHTGGFSRPAIQGLEDFLTHAGEHWQREALRFDAVYTGYLGSTRLIERTEQILAAAAAGGRLIVDPAMADHGRLYSGFDRDYVDAMRRLCLKADVILPNLTESCLLTGMEYREDFTDEEILSIVRALHDMGMKCVILTGAGQNADTTGVLISHDGKTDWYRHPKLSKNFHGTGDIYASAFVGCWMGGKTMGEAARIAADFACRCIENTMDDPDHWYGTKFETALPWLIRRIYG